MRRNAWNTFTRHQLIIINLSSGLVCVMWNHSSGRAQFSREGFLTNRHSAFWQPTHHRACMQSGRGCDVGCREQVITINGRLTNLEHLARQEMMSVMPWGWSWTLFLDCLDPGPRVGTNGHSIHVSTEHGQLGRGKRKWGVRAAFCFL